MAKKTYLRKGFVRKGGVKVKAVRVKFPKLTAEEKKRRASQALKTLLPAAIKWVGKVGFNEAVKKLADKVGIKNPKKLTGWLKSEAKKAGVLSPAHKYRGRLGYRKVPAAAKRLGPKKYKAYLRALRLKKS